jgi:hypothetical protein
MPGFYSTPDGPDIDREIRIEKMKRELEELSGGSMISSGFEEVPLILEETFLDCALEIEKADDDTYFNRLVQAGIEMSPPAELDDVSLGKKSEEVIQALARMRCFIEQTDHLSDSELYEWLWSDGLREETPDISDLGGTWHTSPTGACTDEDTAIHLKYYASEEERARWHEEYPNEAMPSHCPLPYDRDRNLPRPN